MKGMRRAPDCILRAKRLYRLRLTLRADCQICVCYGAACAGRGTGVPLEASSKQVGRTFRSASHLQAAEKRCAPLFLRDTPQLHCAVTRPGGERGGMSMNRKPWPILVGIALVLALAAAAFLGRPRSAAPTATLSSTFAPLPTRSPPSTGYRLPSTNYVP